MVVYMEQLMIVYVDQYVVVYIDKYYVFDLRDIDSIYDCFFAYLFVPDLRVDAADWVRSWMNATDRINADISLLIEQKIQSYILSISLKSNT